MVSDKEEPRNGCCLEECTLEKFGLNYDRPEDFMTPQWNWSQVWFIIYRLFFAIYWFVWLVVSNIINYSGWYNTESNRIKTLIYLTTWNHILMSTTAFIQTFVAIYYYQKTRVDKESPKNFARMNIASRILWVLYNISSTGAIVVTVFYWALVFNPNKPVHVIDIHVHAINSVYILIDIWIIAIPIRLQHLYQPLVYGLTFGLFSLFYHLAGGTNALDQPYIYKALDWSNPDVAVGYFLIAALVGMPAAFLFLFAIYKLRIFIYERCSKQSGKDDTADLYKPEADGSDVTSAKDPIQKQSAPPTDYGATSGGDV